MTSSALDLVDGWDVPHVAAAVFDGNDTVVSTGDVDRVFALASVSKPLAAFAVLLAFEEGIIGLDASVPLPGSDDPAAAVSVRHLLAHAGGLGPDRPESMAAPGSRRIYSNAGFELLADHVAAAAEMPFAEYAHAALVDTLGLVATDVAGSPAHGYRSCVRDLVSVMQAVVRAELLAPSTVAEATTPQFPDLDGVLPGYGSQDRNSWGLGVEIRGDKSPHWTATTNSPGTWGHLGRAGTFLWWDPAAGVGLVVLTDRVFGPWAVDAWPPLAAAVLDGHTRA